MYINRVNPRGSRPPLMINGTIKPPPGYVFLVDQNGYYLVDASGNYIVDVK